MSYDDVDDVRMAAEEAFVYACRMSLAIADITLRVRLVRGRDPRNRGRTASGSLPTEGTRRIGGSLRRVHPGVGVR